MDLSSTSSPNILFATRALCSLMRYMLSVAIHHHLRNVHTLTHSVTVAVIGDKGSVSESDKAIIIIIWLVSPV